MALMPEALIEESGYRCWVRGVYLITKVAPLDSRVSIPIGAASALRLITRRLGNQMRITIRNQNLRLVGIGGDETLAPEQMAQALESRLTDPFVPFDLEFEIDPKPSIGDDHVTAVNLARPAPSLSHTKRMLVEAELAKVCATYPSAARLVSVEHYVGGPCHPHSISCCVVLGGTGRGWTCVEGGLAPAITLACARAGLRCPERDEIRGGQPVKLLGLTSRPDLNGQIGITLRYLPDSKRWEVRLPDGEGCALRATNLEPAGEYGKVLCFWGDAQWSRTQLLGELARGNWGMCRASVSDLASPLEARRPSLERRLLYAPVSEMTDSFIRHAASQMEVERARHALAGRGLEASDDRSDVQQELLRAENDQD